jgi:hypothetical protein
LRNDDLSWSRFIIPQRSLPRFLISRLSRALRLDPGFALTHFLFLCGAPLFFAETSLALLRGARLGRAFHLNPRFALAFFLLTSGALLFLAKAVLTLSFHLPLPLLLSGSFSSGLLSSLLLGLSSGARRFFRSLPLQLFPPLAFSFGAAFSRRFFGTLSPLSFGFFAALAVGFFAPSFRLLPLHLGNTLGIAWRFESENGRDDDRQNADRGTLHYSSIRHGLSFCFPRLSLAPLSGGRHDVKDFTA